jgi:hypothetical protein
LGDLFPKAAGVKSKEGISMRYVVLIVGLISVVGSGVLGYVWMDNCKELESDLGPGSFLRTSQFLDEETHAKLVDYDRRMKAWPFLFGGAAVGLIGVLIAYERRRYSGAVLLLAAAVGVIVFYPKHLYVIIFGSGLVLAALLALFIKPCLPSPSQAN